MLAGNGNDTVIATINDGRDIYDADGGTDTFDFSQTSAAATDTISGLGGNDSLSGDAGNDVLTGGAGSAPLTAQGPHNRTLLEAHLVRQHDASSSDEECERRAQAADSTGKYADYPCWARYGFGRH